MINVLDHHGEFILVPHGACTIWAEEFFSRMRSAEIGHHHHIAGACLLRYAQEASWREDNRRAPNGDQICRIGDEAETVGGFYGILAEAPPGIAPAIA